MHADVAPQMPIQTALPTGIAALTTTNAGTQVVPETHADWERWVSAGRTRNYCVDDPLIDWLGKYGEAAGFVPDTKRPGYDARTDFQTFIMERGQAFEAAILRVLDERYEMWAIADGPADIRNLDKAIETFDAMCAGVEIITQAVLRNPDRMTYGAVDLLVRSDVLAAMFPQDFSMEEAAVNAPALGAHRWHYRIVDVKFHTTELLRDGGAGSDVLPYMAQVWTYNEALGRIQGYLPGSAYLLGRNWTQGDDRGGGALERLARVDNDRFFKNRDQSLGDIVGAALAWVRRLRDEGGTWQVLPKPSVPELYPHARYAEDQPWHMAKSEIAKALGELTLLPGMNPSRRESAHHSHIQRLDEPGLTAAALGITTPSFAAKCDAVLNVNRATNVAPVLPERIVVEDEWRTPADLEWFVDFETVSSLDDDFAACPKMGGQPLIFQIGCGWYVDGVWTFRQWTTNDLSEEEEARIIDEWVATMSGLAAEQGLPLSAARIIHWSAAEVSFLSGAYNSARARHPEKGWPVDLPWFDFLQRVVRPAPVTVKGAYNFGLKSIAKGMHRAGLIPTVWGDGPTDGLGAMVGAWWCRAEAARRNVPMGEIDLMVEIAAYNEVDCRVMSEVVTWLRDNR